MNALTVDATSWHTKVYLWWYRRAFKDEIYRWETRPRNPERANLCPYVRAVLIWSWLRWLFLDGRITAKFRMGWFSWPILSFAFIVLWTWAIPIEALLVLTVIWAMAIVGVAAVHWRGENFPTTACAPRPKKDAKFRKLVKGYFAAIHDRVCPFIEIR